MRRILSRFSKVFFFASLDGCDPQVVIPKGTSWRWSSPFVLLVAALSAFCLPSHGAVLLTGQPNVTGQVATLQITQDITLTVTNAGSAALLFFNDWVATADANDTPITDSPAQNLTYRKNSGGNLTTAITSLNDNRATSLNSVTPRDGYLSFVAFAVTAGDTVTIPAQTITFTGNNSFNSAAIGTFTGEVFLTGGGPGTGRPLTPFTVVPEPSSWAACGGWILCAFATRRRLVKLNFERAWVFQSSKNTRK